jgi:glucokinase
VTCAIGIDLGGSSIKAVAVTSDGILLQQNTSPFDATAELDWARRIAEIVREMMERPGPAASGASETKSRTPFIGISAPGLAAADSASIRVMPGRLGGLEGLDWKTYLGTAARVPVLNDAHAALLGEAWLGAARGFKNVFMLTLGTGVGGAAIVDGRLLKGALGRAGHLGHISLDLDGPRDVCGMPGSLEMLIGNCTIGARSNGRFETTHALVEAHLQGDEEATRIWLQSVRALGCAISGLINVLDPEAVIVGGGIARSGAALFAPLERFVRDTEWNIGSAVAILPAQLGELAGAYGAAWNALRNQPVD